MGFKMKTCSRCKAEKHEADFSRCLTARDGLNHRCRSCDRDVSRLYREKNPDYFKEKSRERYERVGKSENKERYAKHRGSYLDRRSSALASVRGRLYGVFKAAQDRARASGREFSITLDWLVERFDRVGGVCEVTGVPLTLERNSPGERFQKPFNPSLDRIDSNSGYISDNVRIVAVIVNLALNRFGEEHFSVMCKSYVLKNTLP